MEGGAGMRLTMRAAAEARAADAAARPPAVYELNVAAAVAAIRTAGTGWGGGSAPRALLVGAAVEAGATPAEGRLKLAFAGSIGYTHGRTGLSFSAPAPLPLRRLRLVLTRVRSCVLRFT